LLLYTSDLLQCWAWLNPLNSLWSFKTLIFWWTSSFGELASDEVLLMTHHHFRSTFLQMHKASFLLILLLACVLPVPKLLNRLKILSMVLYTWTNISISNWQYLIPCYHQNSQEAMLNTFCFNRIVLLFFFLTKSRVQSLIEKNK